MCHTGSGDIVIYAQWQVSSSDWSLIASISQISSAEEILKQQWEIDGPGHRFIYPSSILNWYATHVARIFIIDRSYRYGAKLTHLTSHTIHNFFDFLLSGEDNFNTLNTNAVFGCPHLDIMPSSYPPVRLKFENDTVLIIHPNRYLQTIF